MAPLLEPAKAGRARYVQDSVANWLNDASRSRPGWLLGACERWRKGSDAPETACICAWATRSLED